MMSSNGSEHPGVYLDNAATTALDPRVIEAMLPYMHQQFGNPSSIHRYGRETRAALERGRKRIADRLNASMGEIFFTSGGTESNNTAIKCAVRDLGVSRVISSTIEHHCVENSLKDQRDRGLVEVEMVSLADKGHVDYAHLEELLAASDKKTLVSLMHANNEVGNLLDIAKVGKLCRQHGAYFHSDTVQTVGHYPLDVQAIEIDFLSGAGHKIHGPKGIGFLYINADCQIRPLIHGGSQERNMRAGTENVYGIIGLAKAVELAVDEMAEAREAIEDVKFYLAERLKTIIPDVAFNGDWENGLYTVLNVAFPARPESDMLLFNLDIKGIAASGGSACSSGSDVGSHVIAAIGDNPGATSVRFSFSRHTTRAEIDYLIETLASIYRVEMSTAG